MSASCWAFAWSEKDFEQALLQAARALGLPTKPVEVIRTTETDGWDQRQREGFLTNSARRCGLDLQSSSCSCSELDGVLRRIGPSLLQLNSGTQRRYLVVLRATRRHLNVLTPTLQSMRVPRGQVAKELTRGMSARASTPVALWLSALKLPKRRVQRAKEKVSELLLEQRSVTGLYLLRVDPGMSFAAQLRERGLRKAAVWTLVWATLLVVVNLCSWTILGRAALGGLKDHDWVVAWGLLQVTAIPLQLAVFWLGGKLLHEGAVLLKQRLLAGALRIDAKEIYEMGSGRLLAMVFESNALEGAGLAGAFALVMSALQLVGAAVVVSIGAGGMSQLFLLLTWCTFTASLAVRTFRSQQTWTAERLTLARSFVEQVTGNRTRVAQQPAERWHLQEDKQLDAHLTSATKMDDNQLLLTSLPARGWLLVSFLGLIPILLKGEASPPAIAIALGGTLQVYASLGTLPQGILSVSAATVAWKQVARLFRAAARYESSGRGSVGCAPPSLSNTQESACEAAETVLDLQAVSFRYSSTQPSVLNDCDLRLQRGDRVLLEGSSGSGKSTLAALMVGLRQPDSGHILFNGLDHATVGATGWRQRVVSAPQFHENYILSATLAFNLLMGRSWPASNEELREAEEVCRALALGQLLDKMPSGLQQVVGETGWQLSHGERSRIFLARALLQKPELLVLDESFGALDAETLNRCLDVVLARASTLVVIAHP